MISASEIIRIVRDVYGMPEGALPLHAPVFSGNESKYVQQTIESTFVSSVGAFVNQFEDMLREITGAAHAIAAVNGTTALQIALQLAGVRHGDLVLTQSLSFVATANAVAHAGAKPVFLDVDRETLGLSPDAVRDFLDRHCEVTGDSCRHKATGLRIAACVPMHTFGHPCRIEELVELCSAWKIPVVEDAAEALGSSRGARHCGTFGLLGTLSFNGNKICTTGGGGAILTDDPELGRRAKHLTTTAKLPHQWRFSHDEVGYNFRLPNLNAALGCAQLEQLEKFVEFKRNLAQSYRSRFQAIDVPFISEPEGTRSNYWLCAILAQGLEERDALLAATNAAGIMTRPIWEPLHTLQMYADAPCGPLPVTLEMASRLVNIPSGVMPG